MSLYGVIASIDGNREALAAVLAALEGRGARRIACLGGIVGYNADPDECVALVRSRCAAAIAGEHDLISLGKLGFRRCSTEAEYALRRTRRELSAASRAYLAALPWRQALDDGIVLGDGIDTPPRICFVASGREAKVREIEGDRQREIPAQGAVQLRAGAAYLVNPGSVDGSRKGGRKLAECALYDSRGGTLEFLRVPYDNAATEAKAAVFGYRINPLAGGLYTLRRRLAARF